MNIGKMKLINKEKFEDMEEEIRDLKEERFALKLEIDNLENVGRLLNERIRVLEDREKGLMLENYKLKQEVKHE